MTVAEVALRPHGLDLLRAVRPKQWVKNLLVFTAPVAAGTLRKPEVFELSMLSLVVFIAASAGCYLINDSYDAERDRNHPVKCTRPVAAGRLSVPVAMSVGAALCIGAVAVALAADLELLAVAACTYILLAICYAVAVKHVAGLELLVLSCGFVLRPLGGAAATSTPPSGWFLAVCCFAALFIVAGKRQVEMVRLGDAAATHRASLSGYRPASLKALRAAAMSALVAAYLGWAVTRVGTHNRVVACLTLIPLVVAFVRLYVLNARGRGDAPEDVLLHDRWMAGAAVAWLLLFTLGLGRL